MNHEQNDLATVRHNGFHPASTIAFRLDPDCRRKLSERAARLGFSSNELARHYVSEMLQDHEERAALREAVTALSQHIGKLREDVEALLTSSGKVAPNEAHQWVQDNVRQD